MAAVFRQILHETIRRREHLNISLIEHFDYATESMSMSEVNVSVRFAIARVCGTSPWPNTALNEVSFFCQASTEE